MQHRIYLFGRPRLLTALGAQMHLTPTAWRVIAVLGCGPVEGVLRSTLAGLVLPNGKLSTLRKLIWDIRIAERTNDIVILEGDDASVRLADGIYCDVRDLLAASHERELSKIYRGAFFEVVEADHPAWTAWVKEQRERLQGVYVAKATMEIHSPDLRKDDQAREIIRLLEVDTNNEAATRAQMLADATSGDTEGVRRSYRDLCARLSAAGERPQDQTTDLFFRLVGPVGARTSLSGTARDPGVPTVCVLRPTGPKRSRGGRLAQSLVVDVTIGLCRVSLFKVIAPHTAWQIGDPAGTGPARDVAATYMVETELIDHIAGHQQIVISLYHRQSRQILWSENVAISASDQWTVEAYNVLTTGILRHLTNSIDRNEVEAFYIHTDPSTYSRYLFGQESLSSLDLKILRNGRQHLSKAYRQSPLFSPIASAMARSYQLEWVLTARGDADLLSRSEQYARLAIEADPYEARGFRELGFCALYSKRFDESIEHYARAERLNPHYADLLAYYADALVHVGSLNEALIKINQAIALNPLCQDSYFWTLGAAHLFLGNYADSIVALRRMKDISPVFRLLAAAHALNGDKAAADECRIKAMEIHPTMTVKGWLDIVSFRDPRQIQHYYEGLRSAGFT